MKLEYKILWADDDEDWVESIKDSICDTIIDYGFQPYIIPISTKEENLRYNIFDLILMDYKLSNTTGDEIIKKVRDLNILTDVVFYSANEGEALKNSVKTQELEGIYYADRHNGFVEKVGQVIESTIKKVQDINNLRGLVMAEVSELDGQMEDILKAYYTTDERMDILFINVLHRKKKRMPETLFLVIENVN